VSYQQRGVNPIYVVWVCAIVFGLRSRPRSLRGPTVHRGLARVEYERRAAVFAGLTDEPGLILRGAAAVDEIYLARLVTRARAVVLVAAYWTPFDLELVERLPVERVVLKKVFHAD
jgi:hypothetical protein